MAFAATAFKNGKAMGSLLSIYPWLFWFILLYQSLLSNGQTNAK
jgi:hypothetical protein